MRRALALHRHLPATKVRGTASVSRWRTLLLIVLTSALLVPLGQAMGEEQPSGQIVGIPIWDQLRETLANADVFDADTHERNRPRDRNIRHAYARYRPHIHDDNAPESFLALGRYVDEAFHVLQAWHTNLLSAPDGRRIVFRAWDRSTGRPVTPKPVTLSDETSFAQWPVPLALANRSAMVVWESSATKGGPPSLVYRVSASGYQTWMPTTPVPGAKADGDVGNYGPNVLLGPEGRVTLVWQRGTGAATQIMVSRSSNGVFSSPVSPAGLPPGASRPIARLTADGVLNFVFQLPMGSSANPAAAMAVFHAVSRDNGASVGTVTRLSPDGTDAGEADLIVRGDQLHVAFRAGPTWRSGVLHTVSKDNGESWTAPAQASPAGLYAEYPSLYPHRDGGVGLEFYGDRRGPPGKDGWLKRFNTVYRAGKWAAPHRLRTNFPSATEGWLQVNFRLNSARENYRPHELRVLLNGHELIRQKDVIPEGTYLLQFDPAILRTDENGVGRNVVSLRTRHMSQAHYNSAAGFRLQVRNRFVERLVVAESQQEADAIVAAESPWLNHSRPDVILFNNSAARLPAAPTIGDAIMLPLLLANLGEGTADGVRIGVYTQSPDSEGRSRGDPVGPTILIENLEPLTSRKVEIEFSYGGESHYYVVASYAGEDFDTRNNVHVVSFAGQKPPSITPGATPTEVVVDSEPASRVTIDFESLAVGAPFQGDSFVPQDAYLSDQFLPKYGVVFGSERSRVAVINLGRGHATSGTKGIGGVTNGRVDYAAGIVTSFFLPSDPSTKAVTNFVSIKPDTIPATGKLLLEAFDVNGKLLDSVSAPDGELLSFSLEGIHSVRIVGNGSSGFDDFTFEKVTRVVSPGYGGLKR